MHVPRAAAAQPRRGGEVPVPAASSPGAAPATCSCATARGSLDVGSHPEYATPECDSVIDLVTHDKAGSASSKASSSTPSAGCARKASPAHIPVQEQHRLRGQLLRGCHENYLVSRHGEFARLADCARSRSWSPARSWWVRKGAADASGGLVLGQPARRAHLGRSVERHHALSPDHQHPRRAARGRRALPAAHVIVGDSNMSEATTLLKVGSTDLVLRMIEAGVVMRDLTLENLIRAIREISHDMRGGAASGYPPDARPARSTSRTGTTQGAKTSSTDASCGPRRSTQVLDLWERALKAVESDDLSLVDARSTGSSSTGWTNSTAPSTGGPFIGARRATGPCLPRHPPQSWSLLPVAAPRPDRRDHRPRHLRGQVGAPAKPPRRTSGPVHPARLQERRHYHCRLGPSQAERPKRNAPCCAGPVHAHMTKGRAPHRVDVSYARSSCQLSLIRGVCLRAPRTAGLILPALLVPDGCLRQWRAADDAPQDRLGTIDDVTVSSSVETTPEIEFSAPLKFAETEAEVLDKGPGNGDAVNDNSMVTLDYLGVNASDGATIDSSYDTGKPATFSPPTRSRLRYRLAGGPRRRPRCHRSRIQGRVRPHGQAGSGSSPR